jgi:FtsP/CotA-like multicopper oxidase with cupredoxin domain
MENMMTLFTTLARYIVIAVLSLFLPFSILAQNRIVNLSIAYKVVNFTGKKVKAIAINNQIPGPTLHFKEGDTVTINVHNHINRSTSLHWHGIILPWRMDGVPGVSQQPIAPGGVFHYHFTLHQFGTYWYHAHKDFQEQEGVYGAMIITPTKPRIHSNKDVAIVLSDWSNTRPEQIYANLKKEGDFYAIKKPLQPSLAQFIRDYHSAKTPADKDYILNAYKMMQTMRMSIYDLSDVAYDAFLLNGHTNKNPWTKRVKVGDIVRLRFIDAGASSIFLVKIPGTKLQVVAADGNDVKPYFINSLTMAPGETFDVLIEINKNKPYILYGESIDTSGAAIGALITQPNQVVDYKEVRPFPKPKPMMMPHDMPMSDDAHRGHQMKNSPSRHGATPSMPMTPSISSPTKYDKLVSLTKTNNPNSPVTVIKMTLDGYMDRYVWFLNGLPEYDAKPIMIQHGKWYRLVFRNDTMMHHPMHIHGHWFILRNGHGAYDPKLHTIDVPPGATVIADMHADAHGQWIFHCHNLIHMKAGMSNIFRYADTPKSEFSGLTGHVMPRWYYANELDVGGDFFHDSVQGSFENFMGTDFNKLEINAEDIELEKGKTTHANVDVFYWHLLSQFWAIKGGMNYVYRPAYTPYVQPGIGIEGLMPYFVDTNIRSYWYDDSLKLKAEFSRDTQLTHHVFLRLAMEGVFASKTVAKDEIGNGLNSLEWAVRPYYQLNPNLAVYIEYQHTQHYGVQKSLLAEENEATIEDRYNVGLSLLF